MPEQLTKHPEVTLQVLRSGGAKCGEGLAPSILTRCPNERFCQLPGGEICVFGLPEVQQMTQISAAEWQAVLPLPPPSTTSAPGPVGSEVWLAGGAGLVAGAVIAVVVSRFWLRRP
jgi:hypothetical protein